MRYTQELIDPQDVINAIHKKKGVVAEAAKIVPCDRSWIFHMIKHNPAVKQAVDEAREAAKQERLDMNETLREKAYQSALTLLGEFDTTMTIFVLKYLCDWEEKQKSNIHIEIIDKPYRDENNIAPPVRVPEISDSSMGSTEER